MLRLGIKVSGVIVFAFDYKSMTPVEMAVEKKASLAAEKFVLAVEKKAT